MANLQDVVTFCNKRVGLPDFPDFPGSMNGLQVENNGTVTKIAAAVDAGLIPFQLAAQAEADFLIVHHGMYWEQPKPITGPVHKKVKTLFDANCALYSCHLPLDAHPEIGNNALFAKRLGLKPVSTFLPYEGNDIGLITSNAYTRSELKELLSEIFPIGINPIEFGSEKPSRIAIVTGSGSSAVDQLRAKGVDTLLTGELKQNVFNQAQEEELNLYLCGHYSTETFGVCALAREVAEQFGLEWEFLPTSCTL